MSLFDELNRRNVFRAGAAYVVAAWLVIQVVETIFPAFGFDSATVRIVVIVLAILFVPTLIFAWAFEMTPEGLKKEKDIDRSKSMAGQTGKKLDRTIMVVLALGLAYFAVDRFVYSPARQKVIVEAARQEGATTARAEATASRIGNLSIAVLPFADLSPAKDNEYLSDGIAEELLNLLARIPQLHVAARTSSFSFKGKDLQVGEIAERLRVAHILEGSVRSSGDQIRITVKLIAADSGYHLWSDSLDGTLDNIFEVQNQIARKIVAALKVELLGDIPAVATTTAEGYALFLQARHFFRRRTVQSVERAEELLLEAISIDSGYAPAWTLLSVVYIDQASKAIRPIAEGHELARAAVKQALAINPMSGQAMAGLAWIAMIYDWDFAEADRLLQKALVLEPQNSAIVNAAATVANIFGRIDEAIGLYHKSIALNPISSTGYNNLAFSFYLARRFEEAAAAYAKALELSPGYWGGHYYLSMVYLADGKPQAALSEIDKETLRAFQLTGLAHIQLSLGNKLESDRALAELIEDHSDGFAYQIAASFAYRRDISTAFEWLERAYASRDGGMTRMRADPPLDNLHNDPRWEPLLDKVGLPR